MDDPRPDPRLNAAIDAAYQHVPPRARELLKEVDSEAGASQASAREYSDHWRVYLPTRSIWANVNVDVPKTPGEPIRAYVTLPLETDRDAALVKRIFEMVQEARIPSLTPPRPAKGTTQTSPAK